MTVDPTQVLPDRSAIRRLFPTNPEGLTALIARCIGLGEPRRITRFYPASREARVRGNNAAELLIRVGDRAVPYLLRGLVSRSPQEALWYLRALQRLRRAPTDDATEAALQAVLQHKQRRVRMLGVRYLLWVPCAASGKRALSYALRFGAGWSPERPSFREESVVARSLNANARWIRDELVQALTANTALNGWLRFVLVRALARTGDLRALPILQKLHKDYPHTGASIAEALRFIDAPEADHFLVSLSKEALSDTREAACREMGKARRPLLLAGVVVCLSDKDFMVRLEALRALQLWAPGGGNLQLSRIYNPSPLPLRKRKV